MLLSELPPGDSAAASEKLTPHVSGSSPCRRCLFGRASSDVSPIQTHLDVCSRRRWNFDFAAMRPLPAGRFQWTNCTAASAADAASGPVDMARSAVSGSSENEAAGALTSSDVDVDNAPQLSSPAVRHSRTETSTLFSGSVQFAVRQRVLHLPDTCY